MNKGGGGKNIAEPTPYTLPPTPYPQATNNDRSLIIRQLQVSLSLFSTKHEIASS